MAMARVAIACCRERASRFLVDRCFAETKVADPYTEALTEINKCV
jgi:hypothetical protein